MNLYRGISFSGFILGQFQGQLDLYKPHLPLLLGTIYFPTAPFCRLMDYHVEHRGCQLPSVNYFVNQAILHGFPGRHIIIPFSISGNLLNAFPCIVCQDVVQALSAFNHMV